MQTPLRISTERIYLAWVYSLCSRSHHWLLVSPWALESGFSPWFHQPWLEREGRESQVRYYRELSESDFLGDSRAPSCLRSTSICNGSECSLIQHSGLIWEFVKNANLEGPGGAWEELEAHTGAQREPRPPPSVSHRENACLLPMTESQPGSCSLLATSGAGKEELPHRPPCVNLTRRALFVLAGRTSALPAAPVVQLGQQ